MSKFYLESFTFLVSKVKKVWLGCELCTVTTTHATNTQVMSKYLQKVLFRVASGKNDIKRGLIENTSYHLYSWM